MRKCRRTAALQRRTSSICQLPELLVTVLGEVFGCPYLDRRLAERNKPSLRLREFIFFLFLGSPNQRCFFLPPILLSPDEDQCADHNNCPTVLSWMEEKTGAELQGCDGHLCAGGDAGAEEDGTPLCFALPAELWAVVCRYLSTPDLVRLSATCCQLRWHALSEVRSHAPQPLGTAPLWGIRSRG